MFKNPFSFSGRIRRTEYGLTFLIYLGFGITLQLFAYNLSPNLEFFSVIVLILFIPVLWFMLAQGAKRCHDRGNSGWFQLIPFYELWLLFGDGEIGTNKYGPNPKGVGNTDEIEEIGNYLAK